MTGLRDTGKSALPTPRTVCTTCGAMVGVEYHPYAYCVLVKAGLNPKEVVVDAAAHYDKSGWPIEMKRAREAQQRKARTS